MEQLKEAAVIARRELVTTDADKLTYNVEADPLSAGSNLIDILRNVPMLSINGDEEVLLNGSKDYKVLGYYDESGNEIKRNDILSESIETIKVSMEGIGGFEGTETVEYEVRQNALRDLKSASVSKIVAQEYTGKAIEPDFSLYWKGAELERGDYVVLNYYNNVNKGTATMLIGAPYSYEYTGYKAITFKIGAKKMQIE